MANKSRILFVDIEWEPAKAYIWKCWDETITPDQLIDEGGMLCFCAKWQGEKEFQFFSKWDDGRDGMAKAALDLLSEAEAVVTFNGDKYDIPKLTGEIVLAGLTPPPPPTSIDVIKTVKKFGFIMNRLAYIGPLLSVGRKQKHEGFNLWKSVIEGDEKAQKRMKKYNIQDVRLLEKLYNRVKPFIKNHPNMEGSAAGSCGACGSKRVHSRGYRRTKYFRIQRLQCQDCGSWCDGTRTKVKTEATGDASDG